VTYQVLGPLVARGPDGAAVALRGDRQRRVLAALLLHRDRPLAPDALAELVWGDALPEDVAAAVHTHVSRLRRQLPPGALVTRDGGYCLAHGDDDVDASRFEALVHAALRTRGEDAAATVRMLDDALEQWGGPPYEEFTDWDAARSAAARLVELRAVAVEERCAALLDDGRDDEALAELHRVVLQEPLRERPRSLMMLALYRSGRQAEALRAFEEYRVLLADELGLEPSPAMRELERAVLDHDLERPAITTTPTTTRVTATSRLTALPPLPRPGTRLLGRDADLAAVSDLARRARVVTLTGPGGVGKTTLAMAVADAIAGEYAVTAFCELAPLRHGDEVADAVATTIGAEALAGVPSADRIMEVLRSRPALLVLDNCEHVIEGVATLVDRLVHETDRVTVLATSRERLAVTGEHVRHVDPLDDDAAIALFVERAQAVHAAFAPTEVDGSDVRYICHRLDGLPLAIELAAARVHALSIREIADALSHRFRLLTGGRRSADRHRSLEEAVAWSFDLLEPTERALCEELSVFAGGVTVASVAAFAGIDKVTAAELVVHLVERSLLAAVQTPHGATRYRMLETVRHFGMERLAARGALEAVQERYANHVVDLASAMATAMYDTVAASTVIAEFEAEFANLRAAHALLLDRGDIERVTVLDFALYWPAFMALRPEVFAWAEHTVDAFGGDPVPPEVLVVACLGRWQRGDFEEGARAVEEGLARARSGSRVRGYLLSHVSNLEGPAGHLTEALAAADAVAAEIAITGDRLLIGTNRFQSMLYRSLAGDQRVVAEAEDWVEQAEREGHPLVRAWARYTAGEVSADVAPDRAREHLVVALELAGALGARFLLGVAGVTFASLESRYGDPLRAARAYLGLLDLWRLGSLRPVESTMLRGVAELLGTLGEDVDAAVLQGSITANATSTLFGPDAARQHALAGSLRTRLGDQRYAEALARGGRLDDDAVLELAAEALGRAL
jgi:predicted ATPase/DNA-binding SARP family transcriptional activator